MEQAAVLRVRSCNLTDICSRASDVPGGSSTHITCRPPDGGPSMFAPPSSVPAAQGLYAPSQEHDACGVAFVVDIAGRASHDIVEQGLQALRNLEHRGA